MPSGRIVTVAGRRLSWHRWQLGNKSDIRLSMNRDDFGFLLAKATQRWNELLHDGFSAAGWPDIRPSYGSLLIPLYEEDGLRMGELARRSRLSKQTMTTMVRVLEREQLVRRETDPTDARAWRIVLTERARRFEPVVERTLADLSALAERRLGRDHLDEVKHDLKEWIQQ